MGILYLLSTLTLLIVFILIKKSDKEINVLSFITISIVAIFCYNAFICYVLTFFTIPIKLWLLTIINLIISFGIGIPAIKKKQLQKYSFHKIDILYISLTAIIVMIIGYINFGIPFNIKYETSDPAVHYLTSVKFAESDSLLPAAEPDEVYGQFTTRKFASYVNSGLLMKCICPGLDPIECYNVFATFGLIILFLTGITLFSGFTNLVKKPEHRLWAFIVSLICMLGYPLNSFLFGFEYMSMGLLIICAILDLIKYFEDEIMNIKCFMILMALLNFGLFCAYFMFIPFVYTALWVYFYIKNYQKTKKILNKDIIILWSITLLVPFFLGYIYHLEPNIYSGVFIKKTTVINEYVILEMILCFICWLYFTCKKYKKSNNLTTIKFIFMRLIILLLELVLIQMLNVDPEEIGEGSNTVINAFDVWGYIYINLYSNVLLFLPMIIYSIGKEEKSKTLKNNYFIFLLSAFTLGYIFILYTGYRNNIVSMYYLSKNYYALWIILIYYNYKGLLILSEKHKYLPRIFLCIYVSLMIYCTINSNVNMKKNLFENEDENLLSVMEIFGSNKTMLFKERERLNQKEIELLMYAKNNLDYNSKIEVVSIGNQYYWSYVLLRYVNYEPILDSVNYGESKLDLKVYNLQSKINEVDYMIYFNRYNYLRKEMFINSEIIFSNESGGIIKYKK